MFSGHNNVILPDCLVVDNDAWVDGVGSIFISNAKTVLSFHNLVSL